MWRQLRHPNVLKFMGWDGHTFKDTRSLAMVSPWMDGGTILDYVRSDYYDPRTRRQPLVSISGLMNIPC
jgi:hypothetical protein